MPISKSRCGIPQHQDFSVGGRISCEFALIVAGAYHLAIDDGDRTDRDIMMHERCTGFDQGEMHSFLVGHATLYRWNAVQELSTRLKMPPSEATSQYPTGAAAMPTMGL